MAKAFVNPLPMQQLRLMNPMCGFILYSALKLQSGCKSEEPTRVNVMERTVGESQGVGLVRQCDRAVLPASIWQWENNASTRPVCCCESVLNFQLLSFPQFRFRGVCHAEERAKAQGATYAVDQ